MPIRYELKLDYDEKNEYRTKKAFVSAEVEDDIPEVAKFTHRIVAKIEKYNNNLFLDLEREKKAIQNW